MLKGKVTSSPTPQGESSGESLPALLGRARTLILVAAAGRAVRGNGGTKDA